MRVEFPDLPLRSICARYSPRHSRLLNAACDQDQQDEGRNTIDIVHDLKGVHPPDGVTPEPADHVVPQQAEEPPQTVDASDVPVGLVNTTPVEPVEAPKVDISPARSVDVPAAAGAYVTNEPRDTKREHHLTKVLLGDRPYQTLAIAIILLLLELWLLWMWFL